MLCCWARRSSQVSGLTLDRFCHEKIIFKPLGLRSTLRRWRLSCGPVHSSADRGHGSRRPSIRPWQPPRKLRGEVHDDKRVYAMGGGVAVVVPACFRARARRRSPGDDAQGVAARPKRPLALEQRERVLAPRRPHWLVHLGARLGHALARGFDGRQRKSARTPSATPVSPAPPLIDPDRHSARGSRLNREPTDATIRSATRVRRSMTYRPRRPDRCRGTST